MLVGHVSRGPEKVSLVHTLAVKILTLVSTVCCFGARLEIEGRENRYEAK